MAEGKTQKRPKVLVEAYECSPVQSHAPGAAWQIISRLAKYYELWILVEETQYSNEIRSYLAQNPEFKKNLHFTFIPGETNYKRKRPVLPIREVLDYRRWLKKSFKIALDLHSRINFDLAHHLRGDSFREPGYLWKLRVPFVWGPTGGTTHVPWCMFSALDLKGQLEHALRNVINSCQLRFSRNVRKACKKAACIISQTSTDQQHFYRVQGVKSTLIHEQAAEPSMGKYRTYNGDRKLNIAWVGQCIARKSMPLLLRAISRPEIKGRVRLHIAGDGSYRSKWEKLAKKLHVHDQCIWHGWLSQDKTLEMLNAGDVLAFTSLLEGTPTTVMQALSLGVPVICLKHCGFGDVVTAQCGFTIPIESPRTAINGFATAIKSLIDQPQDLKKLSKGALRQAETYSWDNLAGQIKAVYENALVYRADNPNHEKLLSCGQRSPSATE